MTEYGHPLFKILTVHAWEHREPRQRLPWSAVDVEDGFIHLSRASQVRQTAMKHFASQPHLVLVRLDAAQLVDLRWEPSRGGDLFPHVHGDVSVAAVLEVTPLVGDQAGAFRWPPDVD